MNHLLVFDLASVSTHVLAVILAIIILGGVLALCVNRRRSTLKPSVRPELEGLEGRDMPSSVPLAHPAVIPSPSVSPVSQVRVTSVAGSALTGVLGVLTPSASSQTFFWKGVAAAGESVYGYTLAAYLVRHSLSDSPVPLLVLNQSGGDLTRAQSAAFVAKFKNSPDLRKAVGDAMNAALPGAVNKSFGDGAIEFRQGNDADLFYAIHKINGAVLTGTKNRDGSWTATIVVRKTYDFQWNLDRRYATFPGLINNLGLVSQNLGVVKAYDILVSVPFSGKGGIVAP